MPIQFPNFPRPGFDETNPGMFGAIKGQELQKAIADNIAAQQQNQMRPQILEQQLQKAVLENQFYASIKQSEIGLRKAQQRHAEAQASLVQQQSDVFPQVNEAEINYKKALQREQEAMAAYHQAETQNLPGKTQAEMDWKRAETDKARAEAELSKAKVKLVTEDQDSQNNVSGMANTASTSQPSIYGVPTPTMTRQDKINRLLYNTDTYGPKLKLAQDQQNEQRKAIIASSVATNSSAQQLGNFIDRFGEYDQLMDSAWLAGPGVGGVIGNYIPRGQRQRLDNLVNTMSGQGIEELKKEMGNSRFAVAEFNQALQRKPQTDWSKETRNSYGAFLNATKARIHEIAKMKQYVLNHPELGVSDADLDAIITTYQNNSPITYRTGKNRGQVNWNNLNNKWQEYLTPKAIDDIKNGRDFKPKTYKEEGVVNVIRNSSGKLEISS